MKSMSVFVCSVLSLGLAAATAQARPQASAAGYQQHKCPDSRNVKCFGGAAMQTVLGIGSCEQASAGPGARNSNVLAKRGYHLSLTLLGNGSVQGELFNGGFDYDRAPFSPPPGKVITDQMRNGQSVFDAVFQASHGADASIVTLLTAAADAGPKIRLAPDSSPATPGKGQAYTATVRVRPGQFITLSCRLDQSILARVGSGMIKQASVSEPSPSPTIVEDAGSPEPTTPAAETPVAQAPATSGDGGVEAQ